MQKAESLVALALMAISALALVEARAMGIGWGITGPKSGFFIFWLAIGLGGASLINLIQLFRRRPPWTGGERFFAPGAFTSVLKVALPMGGTVALMELFGFYMASALYLLFFMRWMGRHSWPAVILVSLLFPASLYLLFERWFLIPLPKGFLEPYLGF